MSEREAEKLILKIIKTLAAAGLDCRALWAGCDGSLRVGRSGDVVTMLDDLNIRSRN